MESSTLEMMGDEVIKRKVFNEMHKMIRGKEQIHENRY